MIVRANRAPAATGRAVLPFLGLAVASTLTACSGGSDAPVVADATQEFLFWNQAAIDCSGLDHAPTDANHVFGEQLGPCRAARAMAITHIAAFEAWNAVEGAYATYSGTAPAPAGTSAHAAVAQAAHDALVALFPSQSALLGQKLATRLGAIADGPAETQGVSVGAAAADAILALRANDGSNHPEPVVGVDYIPGTGPGVWRPDPISGGTRALGARWDEVLPFALTNAEQFRCPTPPDLTSAEYALAFDEVKVLGGDGDVTPTLRNEEQTFIGIYWAYDGTPSLCAPPRLYNQVATQVAAQQGTTGIELARLLTLLNVAMADAGIAAWESKYHYALWRPVTAVREADAGAWGPGDGNASTVGDPTFTPLGAPASNLSAPNFTPPFPAYPSGHATFGGVLFQVLRRHYGTDDVAFTFVSDEFNGVTLDNEGNVRPYVPRTYPDFSTPEEENGQSRIYLGIHWYFDKDAGIEQGNQVADWVVDHLLLPVN